MVNREKVIKGLEYCLTPGLCTNCVYRGEHCTSNMYTDAIKLLKEQPLWVSVTDKLPDDASDVLAYYDNGTESRIIPVNYYKGCWYDCVFNRSIDDLETGFIRYWMSLPKPPEG